MQQLPSIFKKCKYCKRLRKAHKLFQIKGDKRDRTKNATCEPGLDSRLEKNIVIKDNYLLG